MATFKIDAAHSEIGFKIKHLMISNVSGVFRKFDATIESEKEDFSDSKITFEADVDSINTQDEARDAHLKGDGTWEGLSSKNTAGGKRRGKGKEKKEKQRNNTTRKRD